MSDSFEDFMAEVEGHTLKSWKEYYSFYDVMSQVEKEEVSACLNKVFQDIEKSHPDLFEIDIDKYLNLLETYSSIFNELKTMSLYMSIAGHLLITFYYAKGFCKKDDVNKMADALNNIKNNILPPPMLSPAELWPFPVNSKP